MTNEQAKYIADTILSQLRRGRQIFYSWGGHAFRFAITEGKYQNAYLLFRVRGFVYKGLVRVILNGLDMYTLQLVKKVNGVLVVTKELDNVDCESMVEILDSWIEKNCSQKEYEQQVRGSQTLFLPPILEN